MTPQKKFCLTLAVSFVAALLIGTVNKVNVGLLLWNVLPDAALIIRSLIATFVLTLFLMCFDKRFNRRWFVIAIIGLSLSVAMGLVTKAWPAENPDQAERDYVAILKQAESWPLVRELENRKIVGRWHKSNNSDFVALFLWFPNKDKNYLLELFAKDLYSFSGSGPDKLLKSMLKDDHNKWFAASHNRISYIKFMDEDAIKFELFDDLNSDYSSIIIRIFMLKDLIPLRSKR